MQHDLNIQLNNTVDYQGPTCSFRIFIPTIRNINQYIKKPFLAQTVFTDSHFILDNLNTELETVLMSSNPTSDTIYNYSSPFLKSCKLDSDFCPDCLSTRFLTHMYIPTHARTERKRDR